MPKDHYVAQTYLRSFRIPGEKSDGVNIIRKSDLTQLSRIPINSICYEVDWSSNSHFPENPRIVEDFLKTIEPKWPECVKRLEAGDYDINTKFLISAYLAFLRTYTPTAARLGTKHHVDFLGQMYEAIEKKELSNPNSKHLEAIELIRKHGGVKIDVDTEYVKAKALTALDKIIKVYANSPWLVLKNETDEEYVTSDNPLSMDYYDPIHCDFAMPITPRLAIVIHPMPIGSGGGSDKLGPTTLDGVKKLNALTVQYAEDLIIFSKATDVSNIVKAYRDYHPEMSVHRLFGLTIYQERAIKR